MIIHSEQLIESLSFNTFRTARVPTPRSNNETDNDAVDLVIQRQAVAAATLMWQMLNPDQKQRADKNEKVEILINEERSWHSFANDRDSSEVIRGNKFATVSLESFHNGIHVMLGTGKNNWGETPEIQSRFRGHMGAPGFAAVKISMLHPDVADFYVV